MDFEAFRIDRVASHLAQALRWLREGSLAYAAESLAMAREYVLDLGEGEAHDRAWVLCHWVSDLVGSVSAALQAATRAALAEQFARRAA